MNALKLTFYEVQNVGNGLLHQWVMWQTEAQKMHKVRDLVSNENLFIFRELWGIK